jgi:hypothetical protein
MVQFFWSFSGLPVFEQERASLTERLGVFAAPDCTLHHDLPPALIHLSKLAHHLRLRQHASRLSGQKPANVSTA